MSKLPFMSVVVISHNGEKTLPATLDSLQALNYPKQRYEVLVINDASTDNTAAIIERYPDVRAVHLAVNQGVSGARNAGLGLCQGEIYVAFDDDCRADPDWLRQIAQGYATGNPAGVGGTIVEPQPLHGLVTAYIGCCDSQLGARQFAPSDGHATPAARLYKYIIQRLRSAPSNNQAIIVSELYGATGSFPLDVLKRVDGWSKSMSGIEDRDLCQRIVQAFPDRVFYSIPTAKIFHKRDQSLWQYLLRSYRRGPVNLRFYRENHQAPPLFPFPLFFSGAGLVVAWLAPTMLPLFLLLAPQFLYFWWPYQATQHRRPLYLLFAYIQLAEESMVILGIVRGYTQLARQRLHHAR